MNKNKDNVEEMNEEIEEIEEELNDLPEGDSTEDSPDENDDKIENSENVDEEPKNGKVFTQEEVNKIVKDRLSRDRNKGREETNNLQKELENLKNSLKTEKITNALIKHNVRDDRIDDLIKLGDFENEDIDTIDSKVEELVNKYKEWTIDNNENDVLDTLKGKGFKKKISTEGEGGVKTPEEKEVERVLKALRIE